MKGRVRITELFSPFALLSKLFSRRSLVEHSDETFHSSWYRQAVGGMWKEIGELQFQFMVQHGLRPDNYLLDIGCGSLRGGLHFVRYLDPGHYFGVDISQDLLDAGELELQQNDLVSKTPTLVKMGDFEFSSLDQKFDYALAQSVFTHLPLNNIIRCVVNVDKILIPGGRFYATFFENPEGKFSFGPLSHFGTDDSVIVTYFDKDPYHYDFDTFQWLCERTNLRLEYIGKWSHPRDQRIIVFIKEN
jgi:SAM-dependent methyltransferase